MSLGPKVRLREPLDISDWSGPLRLSCSVMSARPGPVINWYVNRQAGDININKKESEITNKTDGTVDVIRYCGTSTFYILPREK